MGYGYASLPPVIPKSKRGAPLEPRPSHTNKPKRLLFSVLSPLTRTGERTQRENPQPNRKQPSTLIPWRFSIIMSRSHVSNTTLSLGSTGEPATPNGKKMGESR